MDLLIVIGKLGAVLGLVLLNGFFVAAEFAIVKVRTTQIDPLAQQGSKRARVAKNVISHLDAYLSATQLGITLASLGLGWIGKPFVGHMLEPVLAWMGITQPAVITTASFAVAFSIITFLHIVLGELAPKSLAIQRAQWTTLAIASPLHTFFILFRPFIWALNGTANYFLRLVGIEPASESELAHSEEELRILLSQGTMFSSTEKGILLKAMELQRRTVREVMVPRTNIVFLSTTSTLQQNLQTALHNQFTRYPLCDEELDNVLGMIHLKDLLAMLESEGPGSRLLDVKREILFFPETTPLEKVLNIFLTKRILMAIAVDEYGGTAGLVTLENVLEELVGEIRDEFDVEPLMVQKVNDTEYLVDGAMPLHEFARMFDIVPESRDVVTVSGYAIRLIGRMPEPGVSLQIGKWQGVVVATEGRTVKTLRILKMVAPVPSEHQPG